MASALEWATDHREELMEDWNLCNQLKHTNPIDPLKENQPSGMSFPGTSLP
ncbi:MAG: hypothetical protein NPIRA04_19140 [Nitrospirales bacterium]|nr:MAG: hypothetical protein NPIRA04_19140 [Nitrospirales bacterium]